MRKVIRVLALILLIAMSVSLIACDGKQDEETGPPTGSNSTAKISIAVVGSGEIGDNGFFDSANEGLKLIEKELGLETMYFQGRQDADRYLDILINAAEMADLVFVVPGYFFEEQLAEVVENYPDTSFVYVDGAASIESMYSISYLEHEGSFLAGVLAASLTTRTDDLEYVDKAKFIGAMGGADMPVIHKFINGFKQGVEYVDEDMKVLVRFAGDHFDPAKGRETALSMYEEGVDILFQVAGPTGLGVFEAASEAQKYVIGVDSDQKSLAPEFTLGSMRKHVGISMLEFVKSFLNDDIEAGTLYEYGLAENGVGIDYGDVEPDLVPADVKALIEEVKGKIVKGEIIVTP